MSKQEKKMKQEMDLLKESCSGNENQVQLIQELLALQKSKSLMMRKRGLQNDIEKRIEQELINHPL